MPCKQDASTPPRPEVLCRHVQVLATAILHHARLGDRDHHLRLPPADESTKLKCSNRLHIHLPARQEARNLALPALYAAACRLVPPVVQPDSAGSHRDTTGDGARIRPHCLHLSRGRPRWISGHVHLRLERVPRRIEWRSLRSLGGASREHYAELQ